MSMSGLSVRLRKKQELATVNGVTAPVLGGKILGSHLKVAVIVVDEYGGTVRKWGVKDASGLVLIDGGGKAWPTQETDWGTWTEASTGFGKKPIVFPCIHVRAWDTEPIVVRHHVEELPGRREHPEVLAAFKRGQFALELSSASLKAQGQGNDLFAGLKNIPRWAWFLMAGLVGVFIIYWYNPGFFGELVHLR